MARNFARVATAIWSDSDWRRLGMAEQWMYKFLLTQAKLNLAGVIDVKLRSWSGAADDADVDVITEALEGLERAGFIAWDRDTDEVALRTFVRWDEVLKNQNLGRGMWSAWAATESPFLRGFLVDNMPDEAWDPKFRPPIPRPVRGQEPATDPQSEPRSDPPSEPSSTSTNPSAESCIRGNSDRFVPSFRRGAGDNDAASGAPVRGAAESQAGTR